MANKRHAPTDTRNREPPAKRNRRYDSVGAASREQQPLSSLPPSSSIRASAIDLHALLGSHPIPEPLFRDIQAALRQQHRALLNCIDELRASNIGNQRLKDRLQEACISLERKDGVIDRKAVDVADLRRSLERITKDYNEAAHQLREQKQAKETADIEDADLLALGRTILAEKTQQVSSLAEENRHLRSLGAEKDRTIFSLEAQIARLSTAAGTEVAEIALESQAERTLTMVRGLQAELAERDAAIETLQATNANHVAANTSLQELTEQLRETAVAATKRASEARSICVDQEKLIQQLMDGRPKDK